MAYRKWQKKKIGLSIEELTKQSEGIVGVGNVNRTNLGRTRIENLKVYGTTLVNLLGKYGNFEVDSNSDGLADGWTAVTYIDSKSLSADEVFGNYSQYVNYTHSAADGTDRVSKISKAFVVNEATYFFSQNMKKGATHTANKTHLYAWLAGSSVGRSKDVTSSLTTNFSRFSLKFTTDSSTTDMIIHPVYSTTLANTEQVVDLYVDGTVLINLTERGALDPIRQAKYGVANWKDLTEAQLEAEIPYFDSVMSVNIKDGTASELTVENRGKTLLSGSPFTKALISDTFDNLETVQLESGTEYVLSTNLDGATFKVLNSITSTEITLASNSFTAPKEAVTIQVKTSQASDTYIFNVQLEEGTVATDYVPPRTDSISIPGMCELHGFAGVFNYIDSNGNFVKNWERAGKTTDGAGAFGLTGYASGSKVICRNKTNGEIEILNAAASITTSWTSANIEILYRLAAAVSSSVAIRGALGDLHRGHNNFICSTQTRESFTGDGYTVTFNTTIIPTSVKVNGLAQTSGVTLGASSVTFTTAPRRKAIIEVFGAGTGGVLPAIDLKVLDASGTVETVPALVDLSVTENEEKTGYLNVNGAPLKVAGNKTYTVTLNKDLIESQDNILEEYRGKDFRLKVANSRDSSEEYLSVCHIDPDASLNYLNGTESINIKCGDLYD